MRAYTRHPTAMDQQRPSTGGRLRSPGGAAIHDTVRAALGRAARAVRRADGTGEPDARAREALDVACELARREGMQVEELLILVKDTWRHLPELQGIARRDADVTLTHVITHCIEQYFRAGPPAA